MATGGDKQVSWRRNVLPQPYNDMMRQYFVHSADEILRRRLPIYGLNAWELRRQQVRSSLISALGGFPERTPLNARIISTHQRQGYHIENVVFESRPSFYVTASVFVPDNLKGPAPGILCPHGHWSEGRYAQQVKKRCVGLARRGYVVISLDAVGYKDREPMGHRRSWYLFSVGQTLQGIELWDNIRAIDYLCSRNDVDPERIGCTGASGGGNQTMYVSALDERIQAAVPVCSVEMVSDYMEKGFCTCETIPGLIQFADLTEICGLIAPRPLLLVHGILDKGFPILQARRAASRIREVYSLYDASRFATFESYAEHDYNEEMRQAMYAWFDRWLMGYSRSGAEEAPEDEQLRVLPEGLPDAHGSLASIFIRAVEAIPGVPEPRDEQAWRGTREHLLRRLEHAVGGLPLRCELDVRLVEREKHDSFTVERFWFRSEPDILIPAILISPSPEGVHDVHLHVLAEGKQALDDDEIESLLSKGKAIMSFDLRGTGETQYDRSLAFLSAMTLGRPITAMRAWDTIRCIDYLQTRSDVGRIHLVGKGSLSAAMTALLAAALDRRASSVQLSALPATLRVPMEDESTDELYLPNILKVADIPNLAALIAPRPLHIQALLADDLHPLPETASREMFQFAFRVYELMGAANALMVGQG